MNVPKYREDPTLPSMRTIDRVNEMGEQEKQLFIFSTFEYKWNKAI